MDSEYKVVTDPYIVQKIRTERFAKLKWSTDEQILKDRPKHVQDFFKKRQIPFRLLAQVRFKRSLFGIFLHSHNKNEVQNYFLNENKLSMMDYDQKTYSENELKHLECNNDFASDLRQLLEKAVREKDVIDYDYLYDNVYALRFCDTPLTFIDSELKKFRRLKILILCGNWITDIPGINLPRSLEYIELFANQIEFIHNFTSNAPKSLIHIGLKRNWLTNDSKLHLLGKPRKFGYLQSLDLSENDIYELEDVLRPLSALELLMCLQLQGNPCSVVNCYKDEVLRQIPWLVQLDNTEILERDRNISEEKEESVNAAIVFTCHRIMGLPKPKKEKGIEKIFYFSIGMPLLEDVIDVKDDESSDHSMKNRKPQKKLKNTEKTKGSSKKSIASDAPYNGPDEYAAECKRHLVDTTFKTERFGWEKIMQLSEEALLIESTEKNFADIRDTFRSSVCVKLIYLVIQHAQKQKKSSGKSKSKTKKNQIKKNDESTANTTTFTSAERNAERPNEIILKKITLAQFACDLHSINWSDKTVDYFWADMPRFHLRSVEVEGSLRSLEYSDKIKAGQSKKSGKSSTASNANATVNAIPRKLTVQIGFGLQRTYFQT